MGELFQRLQEVLQKLGYYFFGKYLGRPDEQFNTAGLIDLLRQPDFTVAAFIAVNLIVFTECGLLIGFLLPGDSLLVTTGLIAWNAGWSLPLLLLTLCASAILGDSSGYSIGRSTGPKLFRREKSFFFRKDHLLKAHAFYERHGGKTIIIAHFIPFLRTFAPVVAGAGRMPYRRFVIFSVVGSISWVCSMLLLGYSLSPVFEKPLKGIFGHEFKVEKHVDILVICIVLASIAPGIVAAVRAKLRGRKAAPEESAPVK